MSSAPTNQNDLDGLTRKHHEHIVDRISTYGPIIQSKPDATRCHAYMAFIYGQFPVKKLPLQYF